MYFSYTAIMNILSFLCDISILRARAHCKTDCHQR